VYDHEKTKHESLLERYKHAQDRIKALEDGRDRLVSALRASAPDHSLLHSSKSTLSQQRRPETRTDVLTGSSILAGGLSSFDGTIESSSPNDSEHEVCYLVTEARTVLPSGWQELGREFYSHYSADLPFIHLPTLMYSLYPPNGASVMRRDSDHGIDQPQDLQGDSSHLLLPFLALTIRHWGTNFKEYLTPGAQECNTSAELSAHVANIANRHLATPNNDGQGPSIHAVQGRLMMAYYEWSVGHCVRARRLLREAISISQDLGIDHQHRGKPRPQPVSVAMAFEAELMGVRIKTAAPQDRPYPAEMDQEVSRRTFWSCYLLDVQFSLGEHRSKLLLNTEDSPFLPSTEDNFMRHPSLLTSFDDSLQIDNASLEPDYDHRRMSTDSYGLMPTPPHRIAAPVRSLSTSSIPGQSAVQGDNILGHYVRSLTLLGRVNAREHGQRQRYVL
jgi:hypothetical protein